MSISRAGLFHASVTNFAGADKVDSRERSAGPRRCGSRGMLLAAQLLPENEAKVRRNKMKTRRRFLPAGLRYQRHHCAGTSAASGSVAITLPV
jgi:hypothetical protein